MTVNGKTYAHREGLTMHSLLDELRIERRVVVVMRGDDTWKGTKVPDTPLAPDDVIEIVTMSAGG